MKFRYLLLCLLLCLLTIVSCTPTPDRQVHPSDDKATSSSHQTSAQQTAQTSPSQPQVFELNVADKTAHKAVPKICLNMIVKNETPVIRRCLESVKPMIDYWVIVDTGSNDGTQDMIREYMKDIPGELHERPWKNFGHNRNEALQLARGKSDYVLFIDADEVLEYAPGFTRPNLDKDFYFITTNLAGTKYGRVQLVNNHLNWRWEGVLHEACNCDEARTADNLAGVTNIPRTDGARSQDPQKYHKDAAILETALKDDPNNTRNVFYLAQSYKDAGEYEKAIKNYQKRIDMGGWNEELFWSKLQIGLMLEALGKPSKMIVDAYKTAYEYRPSRAEPLYRLASYYRRKGDYKNGLKVARQAMSIPVSTDVLFVEHWEYEFGIPLEYSICAYWTGNYVEAMIASNLLLTNPKLPDNYRECIEKNLQWIKIKNAEVKPSDLQLAATGTDG